MNYLKNKNGQIMKGNIPWNKGLYYRCSKDTEFKLGNIPANTRQKYDTRVVYEGKNRNPRVEIKIDTIKKNWISLSQYVWIKNNRSIPKGYVIYHKDHDPLNNSIENLECISRSELMKRNTINK